MDGYSNFFYCIKGYDGKLYQGLTTANDSYIQLNLIGLPLNQNKLFEVTISGVIQTVNGYSNVVTRTLKGKLQSLINVQWVSPDRALYDGINFHKDESMFYSFDMSLKQPKGSTIIITIPPILSFVNQFGQCSINEWFDCEKQSSGITSIHSYYLVRPKTTFEQGSYFTYVKTTEFVIMTTSLDFQMYMIGGALVQIKLSSGTVVSKQSSTIDLLSLSDNKASLCSNHLTRTDFGLSSSGTFSEIKLHSKILNKQRQQQIQIICDFYDGQFQVRINNASYYTIQSSQYYFNEIFEQGFNDFYVHGIAQSSQTNPNFQCSIAGNCLTRDQLFYPQRSTQVNMPFNANNNPHEILYNLTQTAVDRETNIDCVPAQYFQSPNYIPCLFMGGKGQLTSTKISNYGLEFSGTNQGLFSGPYKIFRLDRVWSYMFEFYLFDEKNKQSIINRYNPNMWAHSYNERGEYLENKKVQVAYRQDDSESNYNIYGNRLDFSAPFAGIMRFIQLENDLTLINEELLTYFTKNCKGACSQCRINEMRALPQTFPSDLDGTCLDQYAGQEYMNINFTQSLKIGINNHAASKRSRMLYEKYDLILGEDGKNDTQYPKKIGFQGFLFNGSSLVASKEYLTLPLSFTIEIWFKFTEIFPFADSVQPYNLLDFKQIQSQSSSSDYFRISFLNKNNDLQVRMLGQQKTFKTHLSQKSQVIGRWSFIGVSIMNLRKDQVKMCLNFPPIILDCSTKFTNVYHDSSKLYKMRIGENFRGIIRTIAILNWPKLEYHFKTQYKTNLDCKAQSKQSGCELCSTEYNGGECFPNCELNESPSTTYQECNPCIPMRYCKTCDDSVGVQFCSECADGSYLTPLTGCSPCHQRCKTCKGGFSHECLSCFEGFYLSKGQCIEICGDSKNYFDFQCDDGNIKNLDGQNIVHFYQLQLHQQLHCRGWVLLLWRYEFIS
ncbi:UNKNOWN [Stylonychia lemnae]|uniref:Uncharacterized protein n=1 Tax=Stylonychia lemnae TaxID=5949 RepID=A0A078A0G1_STYLE|nr:UNKNOWN [Stylonychia lemnae]|eukprot:CDW74938.1 UNKNOWN [Stylonychia lemnae]